MRFRVGSAVVRRLLLSSLIFVLACGGDDGTGPSPANVTGTWSGSVSNMSGGGISCSSTEPTQLTLDQSGTSFSGSYAGGTLLCSGPGGSASVPVESGSVINGTVSGNNVTFDLDTSDSHFTGTVNGNSMSGTAQWRINFGAPIGVITLNGNWGAAKQ
jgi:hypothetical protein